jgi:hypothetical protein
MKDEDGWGDCGSGVMLSVDMSGFWTDYGEIGCFQKSDMMQVCFAL